MPRLCIVGLDCLSPQLVFSDYWSSLPTLRSLAAEGVAVPLVSCHPPITVPAWAAMMTGCDPGMLGVYGFRDRADRSYHGRRLASSLSYHQAPLWTLLSRSGVRCRVIGVPQTYPPKPLNGYMVTGCLTPSHTPVTYPPQLAPEVQALSGGYRPDIENFRDLSPPALLAAVQRLTASTFAVAEAWAARDDWDFLMLVDMGADRLHHGLWGTCRPEHRDFDPTHPLRDALRDYYVALDAAIGRLLGCLASDDIVLVVSDHGAQAMHGGIALNDWLRATGRLVVRGPPPAAPVPFCPDAVDWERTTAWADGGYVGRIYLNVRGREPCGVVAPDKVDATLDALTAELATLPGQEAAPHRALRPPAIYREVNGVAPDLLVYLGELRYRALGSLGHPALRVHENDRGPDSANHAPHGVLIMRDGLGPRNLGLPSLYDIAPTVLKHMGVAPPANMIGSALF
jgi:predicted AlkP superfamily phosphohydrolase/phosphomutase